MQQIVLLGGEVRAHWEHQKCSGSHHAEPVTCWGFQLDCLGLCHLYDGRNGQAVVVFHLSSLLLKSAVSFTAPQSVSLSSVGDLRPVQMVREKVHLEWSSWVGRLCRCKSKLLWAGSSWGGDPSHPVMLSLCLAASTPKSVSSHSEIPEVVLVHVASSFWVAWAEFPLA